VTTRAFLAATALLLAAPGVAAAAVPPGDYGGGAIVPGTKVSDAAPGTSWIRARVDAGGSAHIGGSVAVDCGLATFHIETRPGADGSVAVTRTRRWRVGPYRMRAVVTVRGRFDGAAASGTLSARLRHRRPGGRARRCATREDATWQLRRLPAAGAPAPASPGATYFGLTRQPGPLPRPFLLRVDATGGRVLTSVFEYTRVCDANGRLYVSEISPGAPIRPDGTFTIRDRFTLRYRDVRLNERFRVRVDGQFAGGVVSGTLRVTTVARRRSSGKVVDRCDTRPVPFAASV
jgi:hypothetical protein